MKNESTMQERSGNRASLERLIEDEDLGIEVLHPGGLALSKEFAHQCGLRRGARVLEVASGTGETACMLASEFGARVICQDVSTHLLLRARSKAHSRELQIEWVRGDAHALPFADSRFDAVLSECALCNLDKLRVLREMLRVSAPGAVVGMHDLCWKPNTPERLKQNLKEVEGEEPETAQGWRVLFDKAGLVSVEVQDRSSLIPEWIRRTHSELGVTGYLRTAAVVLRKWGWHGLCSVLASERIFADPHLGYALAIGKKPLLG
jgi:SAM-dependent methyltransferase